MYTAIYIVVFFTVGMINAIPFLYPLLFILVPLITGIPFMLFLTKVEKFGMVSIMAVIIGIFWFIMGYTWFPVSYTHFRAHETRHDLVCSLLLEKKNLLTF